MISCIKLNTYSLICIRIQTLAPRTVAEKYTAISGSRKQRPVTEKPSLFPRAKHAAFRSIASSSFLSRSEHDPVVLREEERRQVVDAAVARLPAQHRARRRVPHLGTCVHTFGCYSSRQTHVRSIDQCIPDQTALRHAPLTL